MADLLAQFDFVERAELEQEQSGRRDRDEAVLGGGGDRMGGSLNPFDDQELQSPVAAVQVTLCVGSYMCMCRNYNIKVVVL